MNQGTYFALHPYEHDLSAYTQLADLEVRGQGGDDILKVNGPIIEGVSILVDGGAGNDQLLGSSYKDTLKGAAGNDFIQGADGNDTIEGGANNDELYGNAGNDTIRGGDGNDSIFGWEGQDYLYGDADDDLLDGGDNKDELNGGNGRDKLFGGDGDDTLNGDDGPDDLHGEGGYDNKLNGGSGDDYLDGHKISEAIKDELDGGTGNNIWDYNDGKYPRSDNQTETNWHPQVGTFTAKNAPNNIITGGAGAKLILVAGSVVDKGGKTGSVGIEEVVFYQDVPINPGRSHHNSC